MIVTEYDPNWPREFDVLAETLRRAVCPPASAIHHVGSTSIPGLIAKPILDVDIEVQEDRAIGDVVEALSRLGYLYEGEKGIPDRHAFRRASVEVPFCDPPRIWMDHHLYVCPSGSQELRRHLLFRDRLRADPQLRAEYAAIKMEALRLAEGVRARYVAEKEFLGQAFFDCVLTQRHKLIYLTIDPYNHRGGDGRLRGHEPNLDCIQKTAATWRADTVVEDRWCAHVSAEMLEDPDLLALFLSGSYTEWVEAFRQPVWKAILDQFCEIVRATDVPILAVCGSHQLMAYAFGGWKAVGHMAEAGATPITIADEADGVFRAPNPRTGEVGTFHFFREIYDPIFDGLTAGPRDPLIFSQYHYDQVLQSALPRCAVSLLRPARLQSAIQNRHITSLGAATVNPGEPEVSFSHRAVQSVEECSQVQALRYNVPPNGRILYTTQFHPDLAGGDADGNGDHGPLLIHNFLTAAVAYWNSVRTETGRVS